MKTWKKLSDRVERTSRASYACLLIAAVCLGAGLMALARVLFKF